MSDAVTAIDFETANASPASVCSVGLSTLEDGVVDSPYYSLIHPAENVSRFFPGNIAIHHIHPEDVEDAPGFYQVMEQMDPWLSDRIVCAHNARFDIGCMKAACSNTGARLPHFYWFDTLALSRNFFPQLSHHRLDDMCSYLQIDLNHHNAGSDAYGCLMIVVSVMDRTGIFDVRKLLKAVHVPLYRI